MPTPADGDDDSGATATAGTGDEAPIGIGLFTLRREIEQDLPGTIGTLAEIGYRVVEPMCRTGATGAYREMVEQTGVPRLDPRRLRSILETHGMHVSSAHVPLLDAANAAEVLDEQEALGNRLLVVPTPRLVAGFTTTALDGDALRDLAERFAVAAELAAARDMRIGYHNHAEEFECRLDGERVFDVLFGRFDQRVFAELDVTWVPDGIATADVVGRLGDRLLLVHCRGRLSHSLGEESRVVARIVDLGTVGGDPWPVLRTAHRQLAAPLS